MSGVAYRARTSQQFGKLEVLEWTDNELKSHAKVMVGIC